MFLELRCQVMDQSAADELGNHGNAHTDARNISCFAWAKERMQISEDVNKAEGED